MTGPLPILEILEDVKDALRQQNTVILQAPPGAGKSTVLPGHLLDEPWLAGGKILMLQPRRLAARAVAGRLSTLLGEPVGGVAGYRVRFEKAVSARTRIEVLTEGILTRMIQSDNTLEGVGLVIFDEFHERSLHADLALALCREVQQVLRDDLRILVMSATLDSQNLAPLLGNPPVLTSQGRQFPVEYRYLPQEPDTPLPLSMSRVIRKALAEETGDILAFLPGAGEISRTGQMLQESNPTIRIHPLYGDLPPRQQQEAILPSPDGRRKVVLATSIAETSLTIEGIRVVIDSGLARSPGLTPHRPDTPGDGKSNSGRRRSAGRPGRTTRARNLLPALAAGRSWSVGSAPDAGDTGSDLAPLVLELAQWGTRDFPQACLADAPTRRCRGPGPRTAQRAGRAGRRPDHRPRPGNAASAHPSASGSPAARRKKCNSLPLPPTLPLFWKNATCCPARRVPTSCSASRRCATGGAPATQPATGRPANGRNGWRPSGGKPGRQDGQLASGTESGGPAAGCGVSRTGCPQTRRQSGQLPAGQWPHGPVAGT